MRHSPIRSNEEAVKVWLLGYAGELLSVGIKLGLTAAQQTELQDRLGSIRQNFGIQESFSSDWASHQPKNDPMMLRWFDEHGDGALRISRDA